jgi:hypothetical protein
MEAGPEPDRDPYRSLVRLTGGALSIAVDRIREIEERMDSVPTDIDEAGFRGDMESLVALAVGLASEAPARVAAIVDSAGRLAVPVLRLGRPLADAMSGTVVGRLADSLAAMSAEEAARLAALGRAEIAFGRRLVGEVYDLGVDAVLGHLGGSEALEELVADQALGVTRGAVQEVRETSAAADWLTEAVFRRIARRSRRPIPPKPAGAT